MFNSGRKSLASNGKHFCLALIEMKFISCCPLPSEIAVVSKLCKTTTESKLAAEVRGQFEPSSHVAEDLNKGDEKQGTQN